MGVGSAYFGGKIDLIAAFREADSSRPCGIQNLLLSPHGPNSVNGVVHPAVRQGLDGLDRVTVCRIDPMRRPKPLRKGQLIVAQVHGDNGVGPHNVGGGDGTQPDPTGPEHCHRFVYPYPQSVKNHPGAGEHRTADNRRDIRRHRLIERRIGRIEVMADGRLADQPRAMRHQLP